MTPRAGSDAIDGVGSDGELRVRVRAAPADGAANKAVVKVVASALNVAPSLVQIVSGETNRMKRVAVDVERAVVEGRWPGVQTRAD